MNDEVPGSRPRVVHNEPRRSREPGWDQRPTVLSINGVPTELYTIGALARALSRVVATMYLWERKEWLPMARMRTPRTPGVVDSTPLAPGVRRKGKRLYSRAFIEGVVRIAGEERLLDTPGLSPDSTNFPDRAFRLMRETRG